MTAALYARVSTREQDPRGQVDVLARYCRARRWRAVRYVDHGESGATEPDHRPQLDALLRAARTREVDVIVCTKLDRLARSVRHLVNLAAELEALGIGLVVVEQALNTTTPAGRLLFHVLGAIAEFERDLIADRVRVGIRAKIARGFRWGRPRVRLTLAELRRARYLLARGASLRTVARKLNMARTTVRRELRRWRVG